MTIALIVGDSEARLWGLTSRERIARQLRSIGGIALAPDLDSIAGAGKVLILRADYAYDLRTLTGLLGQEGLLIDGAVPAAAHVVPGLAKAAHEIIRSAAASADARPSSTGQGIPAAPLSSTRASIPEPPPAVPVPRDAAVAGSRERKTAASVRAIDASALDPFEAELRKTEPPLLEPITAGTAGALEDRLYGISYKGITDFVTKWWWPVPAKALVRVCANSDITPNTVTCTGFALMLATCWLFYEGFHFWGLLLGWFMTYLDTVDGKLARVTVQSSKFGHWLDHGMDILHPPFWYWLWGLSIADFEPWLGVGFDTLMIFVFAGYAGGRLIEGAFHGLGSVSLFAWRPFDAWFRLFTARRNPCLVLLTAGWLVTEPGLGFELVALWTLVSSLVLFGRLAFAGCVRIASGTLTSWLAQENASQKHPRSFRTFSSTRRAYD